MSHNVFDERRTALEEQFFAKHDAELVSKLKTEASAKATKEELRKLTGINNEQLLDTLVNLGIGGAATLVMSLYPIIAVAWADGVVDEKERTIIAALSKTMGIDEKSPAQGYLTKWLAEKPEPKWHELWAAYTRELAFRLPVSDRELLKATVLDRARSVAEISGGFLGLAFRVSKAEQDVLDKLAAAFS